MHKLTKQLIELGVVDSYFNMLSIDNWAENIRFGFDGEDGDVVCIFENCYEISYLHDKKYQKSVNKNSILTYIHYIQEVKIEEIEGDFYTCSISAWPLELKVTCKEIKILK